VTDNTDGIEKTNKRSVGQRRGQRSGVSNGHVTRERSLRWSP